MSSPRYRNYVQDGLQGKKILPEYPVVPEYHLVFTPSHADLEVRIFADLTEQEGEHGIGFGFRNPDDLAREAYKEERESEKVDEEIE